jgi:hypothetical protein
MKDISYGELANCQNYAKKVIDFYKMCNNGELPRTASDAELAVREYNKERRSFKALYGYSIRGYINTIVDCIGTIVEA